MGLQFLIPFVVGFAAITLYIASAWSLKRFYASALYAWADKNPVFVRAGSVSIPPLWLIRGVEKRAQRLSQQAHFLGIEGSDTALLHYLEGCAHPSIETTQMRQELLELVSRAKKLSQKALGEHNMRLASRIDTWRAEVSLWAEVVSRFVPSLTKQVEAPVR